MEGSTSKGSVGALETGRRRSLGRRLLLVVMLVVLVVVIGLGRGGGAILLLVGSLVLRALLRAAGPSIVIVVTVLIRGLGASGSLVRSVESAGVILRHIGLLDRIATLLPALLSPTGRGLWLLRRQVAHLWRPGYIDAVLRVGSEEDVARIVRWHVVAVLACWKEVAVGEAGLAIMDAPKSLVTECRVVTVFADQLK